MKKRCIICGTEVENNVRFCPNCGNSNFAAVDSNPMGQPNTGGSQGSDNTWNQNNPPQWQPPTNQNNQNNKSSSVKTIIICIVICILCFSLVAAFVGGNGNTPKSTAKEVTTTEKTIKYTKGTFDGKVYINEWAGLKFVAPERLNHQGDAAEFEDLVTDCGLNLESTDEITQTIICFEKISDDSITEERYLDDLIEDLKTPLNSENLYGSSVNFSNKCDYTHIAGKMYTVAYVSVSGGLLNFTQTYYVRKMGDRMICIGISASSFQEIDEIVSCFY